jgi:TRAP-type C4-dicarboxylate transport system substrate-binding protein
MSIIMHCGRVRAALAGGALIAAVALTFGAAQADDQTYVMKISTPTLHDVPDTFAQNFGAAVEKDSGGRIKAEVYPASQLGAIPRQIEGTQFGAIQCEVVPPEFMSGIDGRFGLMAVPGLIDSLQHGQRLASDPEVLKLMLSLGADKGLHGVALFIAEPSTVVTKDPVRHLSDFKGKKIRIFASPFQSKAFEKLGATPVAMSLADVLPAIQQGAIDGAVSGMGPIANFHFVDAAKFVTLTNQPSIFIMAVVNQKWFDSLPKDLQQIIEKDAREQALATKSMAIEMRAKTEASYASSGGELIKLSPEDQSSLLQMVSSVGADVANSSSQLADGYKIVTDAAARTRQAPSQ